MSRKVNSIGKHSLLATAALLAIGAAPAAHAGDNGSGSYYSFGSFEGTASQQLSLDNYITSITSPQLDTGAISASATGVAYRATTTSFPFEGGTPVSVSQNSIAAPAAGNQNVSSVDLGLAANQNGGVIGVIAGQVRNGAPAVASVSGSTFNIQQEGVYFAPLIPEGNSGMAPLLLNANTATASTTLNQSASSVAGVLATPIASGQRGYASGSVEMFNGENEQNTSDTSSRTEGSVSLSTAQVNLNAGPRVGSRATLGSTTVLLDVLGTPVVDAALAVTDNALAAQYTGNRASSSFSALPGSAALDGSVAVSNLQSNQSPFGWNEGEVGASAGLNDVSVTADVRGRLGAAAVLTGSLNVSGNSLSAVSTGNTATARNAAGATVAGNSIIYSGASVGGSSDSDGRIQAGSMLGTVGAGAEGALALSSVQSNLGEFLVSEIRNSAVSAYANTLGGAGTLSVDGNSIGAAVTGNLAGNRIQADAVTIAAPAAASNAQDNLGTGLAAVIYDTSVSANVGTPSTASGGVTSVSSNRVTTLAAGNLADTQVALSATTLAASGQGAGAMAMGQGNPFVFMAGDAIAANVQATRFGMVYSEIENTSVAARFKDQSGEGKTTGVDAASIRLDSNLLRSQALANDATTGVSLAAASGSASSAVANNQSNASSVEAYIRDAGVLATMGRATGSTVGVEANTIAADAVGNRADNRVVVAVTSLVSSTGEGDGPPGNIAEGAAAGAGAAHAIVSMQRNDAAVDAENASKGSFARAELLGTNVGRGVNIQRAAATDSSVTVNGNVASASATSNQVANTLGIEASAIMSASGYATPLAALSSTQVTQSEGSSTVRVGGPSGGGAMIGVQLDGYVDRSQMSVTDNVASAVNLGNTAANRVAVTGTSYTTQDESGMTYGLTGQASSGSVQNDLSLLNNQVDSSNVRSAITRNVTMGVTSERSNRYHGIDDSTLSVASNRNLAEARNNTAVNTVSASGFAMLTAGAGLLNTQQSNTDVSASAEGRFRVRAPYAGAENSTFSVTDNATQALTVANSASNSATVNAVQLAPTRSNLFFPDFFEGEIDIVRQGTGLNEFGALSSDAAYAIGNVQQQNGTVSATARAANRVNFESSSVYGGTATVTGNTIAGIAQSNSAVNSLALTSTGSSGVSGSVASLQTASGQVSGSVGPATDEEAFLVKANYASWTPMNVSNNVIRTSAGQNEAFNQQVVTGATISGGGRSSSVGGLDPAAGQVWVNADYVVLNQQTGSGNVNATATPGQIGVTGYSAYDAPMSVSGNRVAATANVNMSSNVLSLSAEGGLGASGVVANAQTTQAGATSALVGGGEGGMVVGTTTRYVGGATLAVSGNSLNAVAGGNNTFNTLNATGGTLASGGKSDNGMSFAVLNQQSNSASMNAAVQNATVGVTMGGGYGAGIFEGGYGGMNNSAATVLGNQVQAAAYGNTASNAVGLTAGSGATAMAGSMLMNRQTNSASIDASVSGVTVGAIAGYTGSSTLGVTGNSISAQAIGNSATNVMKIVR